MGIELALQDVLKFFIAILSVLNPLGVIPAFVSMTDGFSKENINRMTKICSFAVFVTIIVSLLFGSKILQFFGISIASFRVGGGILIGMNALNMLQGSSNVNTKLSKGEAEHIKAEQVSELGVVPLAIPLLSGPGTMSTAIIYAEQINGLYRWIGCVVSSIAIGFIVFAVLKSARKIKDKMGRLGLNIMTRIMGLILISLSIESITAGLRVLFN